MSHRSWQAQYPFDSRWLRLPAGQLHYLDEGQGEPLLMIHGNPTWSFYWRRLVRAFRDEFRVVVPDHLGCGLSDKPQQYRYTLQDHIDNLVQLIDQLDLRQITLLGHDWGGPIGLGAALARPDRFQRFVLFNTGAFPPPTIPWRIRVCRVPGFGAVAVRGLNLFSRAALHMAVADPRVLSPTFRAGMLAPYDSWAHRVAVYGFVRDIPPSSTHPTWQTLARIEAGLPGLATAPFQFIWGMRDWCFTPACLDRLRELIPTAQVLSLEDAGHWVVEEAHERVATAVRAFLQSTETGAPE